MSKLNTKLFSICLELTLVIVLIVCNIVNNHPFDFMIRTWVIINVIAILLYVIITMINKLWGYFND